MKEKKYSSQSFAFLLAYFSTLLAIHKKGAEIQYFAQRVLSWSYKMVKTAKIEEAIKQDTEMNLRSKHDSDGPNPDNAEKLCWPHVGGWSTSDHSG